MRSYRLCYRSADFKTLTEFVPPGTNISNPGMNANPGQVSQMLVNVASMFTGKPFFAIQFYNRIAAADQWIGYDDQGNPIDGDSGLVLANNFFDVQFYMDHAKN